MGKRGTSRVANDGPPVRHGARHQQNSPGAFVFVRIWSGRRKSKAGRALSARKLLRTQYALIL